MTQLLSYGYMRSQLPAIERTVRRTESKIATQQLLILTEVDLLLKISQIEDTTTVKYIGYNPNRISGGNEFYYLY